MYRPWVLDHPDLLESQIAIRDTGFKYQAWWEQFCKEMEFRDFKIKKSKKDITYFRKGIRNQLKVHTLVDDNDIWVYYDRQMTSILKIIIISSIFIILGIIALFASLLILYPQYGYQFFSIIMIFFSLSTCIFCVIFIPLAASASSMHSGNPPSHVELIRELRQAAKDAKNKVLGIKEGVMEEVEEKEALGKVLMDLSFCPACGNKLGKVKNFCNKCGKKLST